jgi:hypothetical protein
VNAVAVIDDVGRHLPEAGSFDRAAVPLGMFVAWLAQHQLLSEALSECAGSLITRVRFREITGSELLVSGCGGALEAAHLSAEGLAFTEHYYGRFLDDFRDVFGDDVYAVDDDWAHYDRLAPRITEALMGFRGHGRQRDAGGKWWKFWR